MGSVDSLVRESSDGLRVRGKEAVTVSFGIVCLLVWFIKWLIAFLPTKAFTLVCRAIHKHFGGDDITERQEHLHKLAIPKLLRQVIDEQVTAFWPCREREGGGERQGREGETGEGERNRGERVRETGKGGGYGAEKKRGQKQEQRQTERQREIRKRELFKFDVFLHSMCDKYVHSHYAFEKKY